MALTNSDSSREWREQGRFESLLAAGAAGLGGATETVEFSALWWLLKELTPGIGSAMLAPEGEIEGTALVPAAQMGRGRTPAPGRRLGGDHGVYVVAHQAVGEHAELGQP